MIVHCPHRRFVSTVRAAIRALSIVAVVMTSALLLLPASPEATGHGIQLASDAPLALTPEESRRLFHLPPGFSIELVASEPHLADPVARAFDSRGRIVVCEIHGYNLESYLDIQELNQAGESDTQVRRIPANDDAVKQAEKEQYGTVKVLEDSDGDGRIDRSTVLADRLPPCYGVVSARDGVIVFCARTLFSSQIAEMTARRKSTRLCSPVLVSVRCGPESITRAGELTTGSMASYEQVCVYSSQAAASYYSYAVAERHFGLEERPEVDVSVEFYPSGELVQRKGVRSETTVETVEPRLR